MIAGLQNNYRHHHKISTESNVNDVLVIKLLLKRSEKFIQIMIITIMFNKILNCFLPVMFQITEVWGLNRLFLQT